MRLPPLCPSIIFIQKVTDILTTRYVTKLKSVSKCPNLNSRENIRRLPVAQAEMFAMSKAHTIKSSVVMLYSASYEHSLVHSGLTLLSLQHPTNQRKHANLTTVTVKCELKQQWRHYRILIVLLWHWMGHKVQARQECCLYIRWEEPMNLKCSIFLTTVTVVNSG